MFKEKLILEAKGKEDRLYTLTCEKQAPLGELWDALNVMRAHVFDQMQRYEDSQKKEEPKENDETKGEGEILCQESCEAPQE